jgi:hypothetical protein
LFNRKVDEKHHSRVIGWIVTTESHRVFT